MLTQKDKLASKLSYIEQLIQKDSIVGLKSLRSTIASLTPTQAHVHSTTISTQLYNMLKSREEDAIIHVLDCIQGLCLLSYPSKQFWANQLCLVLTFLASRNENILIQALECIEAIIIDCSTNQRIFESLGGVELVCDVRMRTEQVMYKVIEVMGVYLLPESCNPDYAGDIAKSERVESKLGKDVVHAIQQQIRL